MADKDKIPTSRIARTARIGRLAAGQALRSAGTKTANIARDQDGRRAAAERRNIEAAEQIVTALGTMKGAAMKIGQVLSFLDAGLVPPEYQEEFQKKLATLRDAAPTVTFDQMRKVIEADLDAPITEVFSDFDPEPIAAASIGQVYRATLARDGRAVAVKVQYPGVAAAVRADMKNLTMIMRLAKRIAPGIDVQAMSTEIRERIEEELDYELEATNQQTLARLHRGHPFIVIPDVVSGLCREHTLVTEFVEGGIGFEDLKQMPDELKNRAAEIIFRFYFGCMYRHHAFSGDPHPGNSLLLPDGRMAFLDFGLFKRLPAEAAKLELDMARAVVEGDTALVMELGTAAGFFPDVARLDPDRVLEHFRVATSWYSEDQEMALTPAYATQVLIDMSDPRSDYFNMMRHENMPADNIFNRRTEVLCLAVMAQLNAHGNFHRIFREWIYGDPPTTELGELEAAFYG